MERKWTSRETAEFLQLSRQTLAAWRWQGVGPPYEKLGGAVRYDPSVVKAWAASRTRQSTSDACPAPPVGRAAQS